jgi:hypothetical protein
MCTCKEAFEVHRNFLFSVKYSLRMCNVCGTVFLVRKRPLLAPALVSSHTNSVHTLTFCSFEIHFNIDLKLPFFLRYSDQNTHMNFPSPPQVLGLLHFIWFRVQFMKLLFMKFSPDSGQLFPDFSSASFSEIFFNHFGYEVLTAVYMSSRLCGPVVRVPGYRSRGAGFEFRRYQII